LPFDNKFRGSIFNADNPLNRVNIPRRFTYKGDRSGYAPPGTPGLSNAWVSSFR